MRAIRHGALVAVLLGLAAMPSAAGAQTAAVAHRMDAAHSGSTGAGPAPPLRRRWTRALEPEENAHPELSYPLVAGGRVFIVAARALHALSAQTGETLWSVPSAPGSPAYDAGRVVVTTAAGVKAFDAATGAPLWSRELETHDCPAVASGGVVYTISGWTAHALRLTDGSTLWSRAIPHGCEATVGGDLVHYSAGGTTALRRTDGTVAWTSATGGRTAALHGGRLMDARMLQAVDPASGAVRWEFAAEHGIHTTPAVAGVLDVLRRQRRRPRPLRTAIAGDGAGRAVIAGIARAASDFPATPGAYDTTPHGSASEAFAARLSAGGSAVEWATTFGGGDWDDPLGMALDAQGRPVVVGATNSPDFPTTPGAQDRVCETGDPDHCESEGDVFATKLAGDGSALVWSTFLGGAGDDVASAVTVGGDGGVVIAGKATSASGFPFADAFQTVQRDGPGCASWSFCADAFLVRLSDAGALELGSLLGGDGDDGANGVALDPQGDAWVAGLAHSRNLPVSADAVQPVQSGGNCGGAVLLFLECADGFLTEVRSAAAEPDDPPPAPSASAPVTAAGAWRTVARTRTADDGRYRVRLPARRGAYRVRAPGGATCADAAIRPSRAASG